MKHTVFLESDDEGIDAFVAQDPVSITIKFIVAASDSGLIHIFYDDRM